MKSVFPFAFPIFVGLAGSLLTAQVSPSRRLDATAERELHDRQLVQLAAGSETSRSVMDQSCGLGWSDGTLWGMGPDYKVRVTERGFEFTPALGGAVERNRELSFELDSIGRGGSELKLTGPTEPALASAALSRAVAPDIEERLAFRRDGTELSYRFASLPSGQGDLVVRLRVRSNLPLPLGAEPDGSLRLVLPAAGGASIGAVTGIDARGSRCAGGLHLSGGMLELSLPAAFVEQAALPIVLDPLISTVVSVAVASTDDGDPDVAFEPGTARYLVVWERQFSASDIDIRGQLVSGSAEAGPIGSTLAIESSPSILATNPTVGSYKLNARFLVAWQQAASLFGPWDIYGLIVQAASGSTASATAIANSPASEVEPDAGNESSATIFFAPLAYREVGAGIRVRMLGGGQTVPGPLFGPLLSLTTAPGASKPCVSPSGGGSSRYLVGWQEFSASPAPGHNDLKFAIISQAGSLLVPAQPLAATPGADEEDMTCDGNGQHFVAAYEREASAGSGDNDIVCQEVDYDPATGSTNVGPSIVVEGDPDDDEVNPAIGWAGEKYLLAWADEVSGLDYDVGILSLSPQGCLPCEVEIQLADPSGLDSVEVASRKSGDPTQGDGALIVWGRMDLFPPFASDVYAQYWEAVGAGGTTTSLGGGCGGGGSTGSLAPAAIGSAGFTITLSGADPSAVLGIMNASPPVVPLACGSCEWNPFFLSFTAPITGGSASRLASIPCDVGLVGAAIQYQWTVIFTSSSPCPLFPGISVSDRIEVVFGQ